MVKSFTFIHASGVPGAYQMDVSYLLNMVDEEFVPPLSTRDSTHDRKLNASFQGGIESYLEGICQQEIVMAFLSQRLVAILSYKRDEVLVDIGVTTYISTIAVDFNYRRMGLAQSLYEQLEERISTSSAITTRTWSSNISHISLLEKRGYSLVREEPNARGEGISTVYYTRKPSYDE